VGTMAREAFFYQTVLKFFQSLELGPGRTWTHAKALFSRVIKHSCEPAMLLVLRLTPCTGTGERR
jgi:hypothetical protein